MSSTYRALYGEIDGMGTPVLDRCRGVGVSHSKVPLSAADMRAVGLVTASRKSRDHARGIYSVPDRVRDGFPEHCHASVAKSGHPPLPHGFWSLNGVSARLRCWCNWRLFDRSPVKVFQSSASRTTLKGRFSDERDFWPPLEVFCLTLFASFGRHGPKRGQIPCPICVLPT